MMKQIFGLVVLVFFVAAPLVGSAATLSGRVEVRKQPVAEARVGLWVSGGANPITQAKTNAAGEFRLELSAKAAGSEVYYLVAEAGSVQGSAVPKLSLLAILGTPLPKQVVLNEFTSVASTWPNAQLLEGTSLRGSEAGLRIGAAQVANLVDVTTGGYGETLLNGANLSESTTLAKLNTLASLVALCGSPERGPACASFLEIAQAPDTGIALQKIARQPWRQAAALYDLFTQSYPAKDTGTPRPGAALPYLLFEPADFALQVRFSGGGLNASGKLAFDDQGNLWTGNNWMPGSQSGVVNSIGGGVTKLGPGGRALSPAIVGFNGQQLGGIGWGTGVSQDRVWLGTFNKTIGIFDLEGKPLGPISFDGKTGQLQGVGAARNGDVWIADAMKNQMVWLPGGDPKRVQIVQVPGLKTPFGVAVDLQNRVWVTSSEGNQLTVFPAENPSAARQIEIAVGSRGIALDSKGNAWVAVQSAYRKYPWWYALLAPKKPTSIMQEFQDGLGFLEKHTSTKHPIGQVALISPELELVSWSFGEKQGIYVPWGMSVDGDDQVWVANFYGEGIVHMCGADPTRCPAGKKTGDVIHIYQSGVIEKITDAVVDEAGNVWTANNWDNVEALDNQKSLGRISTMGGGHGVAITYGIAKPVRNPLLGPVRSPEIPQFP